jgi:hypothetical protein
MMTIACHGFFMRAALATPDGALTGTSNQCLRNIKDNLFVLHSGTNEKRGPAVIRH